MKRVFILSTEIRHPDRYFVPDKPLKAEVRKTKEPKIRKE